MSAHHPGLGPKFGAQWRAPEMARAYAHRPPYPIETFDLLADLVGEAPRVLDIGCGTGDLTCGLAVFAESLDALDPSAAMLEVARTRAGTERVCWLLGCLSNARLAPPYDLITAGECIQWLDWDTDLTVLAQALSPQGVLAVIDRSHAPYAWDAALRDLIKATSTNREFVPYDSHKMLAADPRFECLGQQATAHQQFAQPIADHIEAIHSRNGFSRAAMTAEDAAQFDAAYRALIQAHGHTDVVPVHVSAQILWGRLVLP